MRGGTELSQTKTKKFIKKEYIKKKNKQTIRTMQIIWRGSNTFFCIKNMKSIDSTASLSIKSINIAVFSLGFVRVI